MNARSRRIILLLGLASMGLIVYGLLVYSFPIAKEIKIPRSNVGSLTKRSLTAAALLAAGGLILHGAYIAAALVTWRTRPGRLAWTVVWGYPLAAGAVLVLLWPITSTDVFDYIFRGRMGAHYDVNPYTVLPNRYKTDPLYAYLGWPNAPSAYGPLWEMMSERMAAIAGVSVWTNILLHKALALVTFLLCGALIARMARTGGSQQQIIGSVLWLWSPLAIWEIAAIGHNDGFLILSVLLAIWATQHGRHHWAAVALVIGALFKVLPLIVLPLVVLHGMRERQTWAGRIRLVLEIGLISAILIVAAYAPYWEGWATLYNIRVREKFLNAAPLAIVTHTLSRFWSVDLVRPIVSRIGSTLLLTGILWQMWQIWRHGRDLWTACFWLFTWYLVIASQWFQPWYVLWLLALLAVRPAREHFAWIEAWALSGQASYLLQYFILFWLKWPGNQLPAQVLYLLIIFVPPLLVWGIGYLRRRSSPPPLRRPEPALAS